MLKKTRRDEDYNIKEEMERMKQTKSNHFKFKEN